jgi:indoleamine 2,3-dioxygenase
VDRFGGAPQRFRGQTGAQDDVIPTVDVFSGVEPWYPENELTRYLLDLRDYRPPVVQRWLEDLRAEVRRLSLWDLMRGDPVSAVLLLGIVEQVYLFRNGHWQFVQKYILANTRYTIATGGTPVTTWIPNQIEATLAYMGELLQILAPQQNSLPEPLRDEMARNLALHPERVKILHAQIDELTKAHYDAKRVYDLNRQFAEGPAVT